MIPLCDPSRDPHLPEIQAAVARVIESGRYVLGLETIALECEFRHLTRAQYAVAVSSCTDALLISYEYFRGFLLGIPALTFVATAESAIRAGHSVRYYDLQERVHQINRIDVSLFGVDRVRLEYEPQAWITDKAQCFPTQFDSLLSECYSFFPAKPLGTLGDGGMIVTNNEGLYEYARRARNHGSADRRTHLQVGGNHRMAEVQAACINVKLRHLDYYRRRLENVEYLRKRVPIVGNTYANTIGKPDDSEIETKQYYPLLVPEQPAYLTSGEWPKSKWFSERLWAVPCGPELTREELDRVVRACEGISPRPEADPASP